MNTKQDRIKILLVDSDEMMRIYFRDIFWMHGRDDSYEVDIVSSLEEAEKKLEDKDTRPDILFLDVLMSAKGKSNSIDDQVHKSISFIERIKKEKDLEKIKVVIYSSQKEKLIKDEICKLGVEDFLTKGELMPKEIIAFVDKIYESNNNKN